MDFYRVSNFVGSLFVISVMIMAATADDIAFDTNYYITWGNDHVTSTNQGLDIQLMMDQSSGCGFASKERYRSGYFHMRIKAIPNDSAGTVTSFYLISNTSSTSTHDELDFEFLGNVEGQPITLQTNIYINGQGNREQRLRLWFDPTADFHNYVIIWNEHQIVWYVDDFPVRVFKNNTQNGSEYPTQVMRVEGSLWDGGGWTGTTVNWSDAPFIAHYQQFNIDACPSSPDNPNSVCYSSPYWWNSDKFWTLDPQQQSMYEDVKTKYIYYDYCTDRGRFPTPLPECNL